MYLREWRGERSEKGLKVMQFNTLADGLCGLQPDKGLFDRSPVECLDWDVRKQLLLQDIHLQNADILCCQEMDHFHDFFQPHLQGEYIGIFEPKRMSKCLDVSSNPDGCAIFLRKNKFQLLSSSTLHFQNQNQLALFVTCTFNSKKITICTTHLKAQKDEQGEEIRKAQVIELLDHLKTNKHPIIIAGDLNTTPNSYVYPIFQEYGFESGYKTVLGGNELEYSTWKSRVGKAPIKHTIDYIWYSKCDWHIYGCLDVPKELEYELLPSLKYGSDHFSLLVELNLI